MKLRAVGLVTVLLLGGCASNGGDQVVSQSDEAETGQTLGEAPVAAVVAANDGAWVITDSVGELGGGLWWFDSDGSHSLASNLDGFVVEAAAVDDGVALTLERCHELGDPPSDPDSCRDRSGVVEFYYGTGSHRSSVELWRSEDANALRVVGVVDDQVWISGDEFQLVDPDDGIVASAPRFPGEACVVDSSLEVVSSRNAAALFETRDDQAPPTTSDLNSKAQDTFTVRRWTGERWLDIEGGELDATGDSTLDGVCADGFEVFAGSAQDAPLHFWDGQRWDELAPDGDTGVLEAIGITRASDGAALGVNAEGSILRRSPGSIAFSLTGLEIGFVPDPATPPPSILIDVSDDVGIVCIVDFNSHSFCEIDQVYLTS